MKLNIIKTSILAMIISFMLVPGVIYSDPVRPAEETRFADLNVLLVIYRSIADVEKSSYGEYVVTKVVLLNREKYSTEFNYPGDIDSTPEGFITVSYYAGKRSITELNSILEAELPEGRNGALRLAAMWLKKSAEERVNSVKYHNVISGIMKKSGLEWPEVLHYYKEAIRVEIERKICSNVPDRNIASSIVNEISAPLISYYTNPSDDEERKLLASFLVLYKKNNIEGDYLSKIMIQLSGSLYINILIKAVHYSELFS